MNLEAGLKETLHTGLRLLMGFGIFTFVILLMPKGGNIGAVIGIAGLSYAIGRGIFPPQDTEKEEHED